MEIYTYYKLLSDSKAKFINDFGLPESDGYYFQPGILTDEQAVSGKEIDRIDDYPNFKALVKAMEEEIGTPIEFFTYRYPSRRVHYGRKTKRMVDLSEEIQIKAAQF